MPQFVEQRLPIVWDAHTVLQPGGTVEVDAELFTLGIGSLEILLRPVVVFTHQFHVLISSLRHLFQTLLKRQIGEDRPQHHRQTEGHAESLTCICRQWRLFAEQVGNVTHSVSRRCGSSNSLNKSSSIHRSP